MTSRHELLLHVLCVCVRALTFDQAMRLLGIRDEANFRRSLERLKGTAQKVKLHYDHGYGGGGAVTADMIQHQRRTTYLPDADIVISGHVHESWMREFGRKRVTSHGIVYQDTQLHLKMPSYKDDYGDGFSGWHVETGKSPRPLGAWWLRFFWSHRDDAILYEPIRAK